MICCPQSSGTSSLPCTGKPCRVFCCSKALIRLEIYTISVKNYTYGISSRQVCPLICEELLLRLLNMGCEEIRVTYKMI